MIRNGAGNDYDYIIRVIQYLDRRHGIRFFITSSDFDVLYRWWEKGIPETVIHESLDRVIERSRRQQKQPGRFSAFSYQVRKNYRSFLSLAVGGQRPEPADPHAELAAFLANLPPALEIVRNEFASRLEQLRRGGTPDPGPLEERILDRFLDDGELNAKTAWFLKNLAPPLRRPEIERRYRLNYVRGKFGIPSLD